MHWYVHTRQKRFFGYIDIQQKLGPLTTPQPIPARSLPVSCSHFNNWLLHGKMPFCMFLHQHTQKAGNHAMYASLVTWLTRISSCSISAQATSWLRRRAKRVTTSTTALGAHAPVTEFIPCLCTWDSRPIRIRLHPKASRHV